MLDIAGNRAPERMDAGPVAHVTAKPIRLILVDDDVDFRDAASAELEDLGFAVTSFADGWRLLSEIANGIAGDVIVLDWMMPAMPGLDLLKRLRDAGVGLPVVFLTGRSTPSLEGEALDHGALDFVDKTRGLPILARRVRKILDAAQKPVAETEEIQQRGPLLLNGGTSRAFWNGAELDLTLMEFRVVRLLATSAGDFVSYRAVYDVVHHTGFVAGNGENGYRSNVRSIIKRIRAKIRAVDPTFDRIENYPSFGYRWEEDRPQEAPGAVAAAHAR
ncbi:response regulator transcription factor [Reyranella sp.]|jgi:two-component system response regulator ChvI|uniref:response regulator transcription factor n=1 Tax=Reyranella sp. TaxID=1929291 RepID=UPI002F937E6F